MKPKPELVKSLIATERAHSQAFSKTQRKDVHWAKWYAKYLIENTDFQIQTEREWTAQDLAEALSDLQTAFVNNQPKTSWVNYYASRLVY
jgi:hypothetical protein